MQNLFKGVTGCTPIFGDASKREDIFTVETLGPKNQASYV